jgi:UrcA family protein
MYIKTVILNARSLVGAATVACTLFAGSVVASEEGNVTVALQVSSEGLHLNRPDDARTFYARLNHAAWVVCTHGKRVDLVPSDDPKGCHDKALGDAVRAAKVPMVTQVYLAFHTIQEAAAYGIDMPERIAAK